jgi:hypothetical protein
MYGGFDHLRSLQIPGSSMRLFQNCGVYPSYLLRLNALAPETLGFDERRRIFLEDRYGALHILQPILEGDRTAFFTNADDNILQRQWARENGIRAEASLEDILLAQIEHHQTEVFYNQDPVRYPSAFVRKLPGCVRKTLCWRAAPSGRADFSGYDLLVNNFPAILADWKNKGCRVARFSPAIDPEMSNYGHGERPIDVLFVGGYSRHHLIRAKILERVASLAGTRRVVYGLDTSRFTRLAESPIGIFPPLRKYRRPASFANVAKPPVFGRQLYEIIGKSKIVLNGTIDMAGPDRGNMRCFEAMGCGALLVSDAGNYPEGMRADVTMATYDSADDVLKTISRHLDNWSNSERLAVQGRSEMSEIYTKSSQWAQFVDLVAQA